MTDSSKCLHLLTQVWKFNTWALHSSCCLWSTLPSGQLEVIMDRRLMQDDNRGLGQGLKDNKKTANRFRLLLERRSASNKVCKMTAAVVFPAHHSWLKLSKDCARLSGAVCDLFFRLCYLLTPFLILFSSTHYQPICLFAILSTL